MDIPETLVTLGTQDKDKQTKKQSTTNHRKLKRWATCTPPKPVVNPGAHEGYTV
jgi:hypothetical protein